jgi:hypothetical protein
MGGRAYCPTPPFQLFSLKLQMDITEEQLPPTSRPPVPEKGIPPTDRPDRGPKPDFTNPEELDEEGEPVDPLPDMDPDGQDPNEDEVVN